MPSGSGHLKTLNSVQLVEDALMVIGGLRSSRALYYGVLEYTNTTISSVSEM